MYSLFFVTSFLNIQDALAFSLTQCRPLYVLFTLPVQNSHVLVQKRNMLRLTAKSTVFGHRTFTSWLIESAGTLPIKRQKDYFDEKVDNSEVMEKLMEVCFLLCDSFIPCDNGNLSTRH